MSDCGTVHTINTAPGGPIKIKCGSCVLPENNLLIAQNKPASETQEFGVKWGRGCGVVLHVFRHTHTTPPTANSSDIVVSTMYPPYHTCAVCATTKPNAQSHCVCFLLLPRRVIVQLVASSSRRPIPPSLERATTVYYYSYRG